MQRRLAAALGVDPRQLRALTVAALRLDLRSGSSSSEHHRSRWSVARPIRLLLAYALTGLWVALAMGYAPTLFSAALLHLTALALMVGVLVVLEFNSIVLSVEDLDILGHQPVTSATFFFSRLAHSLIYTQGLGLSFSLAPLLVLCFAVRGFAPAVGLTVLIASSATCAVVTLAGVAFYAGIVRFVSPRRMRALLTSSQLVLSLLVYSAFLLVRRQPDGSQLPAWSLEATPGLLWVPSSWFAAWVAVVDQGLSWPAVAGMLLSLLAAAGLLVFSTRVLSLQYAERMLGLREPHQERSSRPRRGWLFRRREERAVGLLVPRQFRHDYRFRLGVLGVLPLTLLYLVIGLETGPPLDPFLSPRVELGSALLYMAILISPALLVPSFVYSDSFAAAWLYHVTPVDRRRLVLSLEGYIALSFSLPYLGCIAGLFTYFYGSLGHALAHTALLGLCSGLFLTLALLLNPGLPFSAPPQRGRFSVRTLVPFSLAPFFTLLVLPVLLRASYQSWLALSVSLLALLGLNWVWGRYVAGRIARRFEHGLTLG